MDIPRERVRNLRPVYLAGGATLLVAVLAFGVTRVKPAAPSVEKSGVWIDSVRRGSMPPRRLTKPRRIGVCAKKLTNLGNLDAILAQRSIRPIANAEIGLGLELAAAGGDQIRLALQH